MLRLELGDLKELGFDLTLTGFDEVQLGSFLADKTVGLTDPDAAPALPEHPVTEPGDLWLLGRHRLLCGDSTVATDVERVLGGVAPHLMVTDPPYGVNYDPAWRNRAAADGNIGQKKAAPAAPEPPLEVEHLGRGATSGKSRALPGSRAPLRCASNYSRAVRANGRACGKASQGCRGLDASSIARFKSAPKIPVWVAWQVRQCVRCRRA
jgi:hypothetical protein